MSQLRVTEVAADDPLVAEVHRDLLVPGFDAAELVPVEALRLGLEDGGMRLLVASTPSMIVGAAVTEGRPEDDVHLLSYLASRPGHRSTGVGSVMMARLLERWAAPDGPALVLAEVHDPSGWATTSTDRPGDRLRFYARFGARQLPFPWVQPRLSPERDRVRGMLLLVLHARPPALVAPSAVDREMVLSWIVDTQDDAEGFGAGEDAELRAVRDAVRSAPDPLPLVPLITAG